MHLQLADLASYINAMREHHQYLFILTVDDRAQILLSRAGEGFRRHLSPMSGASFPGNRARIFQHAGAYQ